ncbi:MAG: hypothetical protein N4A76_02885 [Firmicutes bacterium]|jgi:hypothetical protein|nr:hypothetical protein [Bacillota bacterium]
MSKNTTNLKLYKKEPDIDLKDKFDVKTMLNDNWDKIDQHAAQTDQRIEVNENARHVHGNKSVLDKITQGLLDKWDTVTGKAEQTEVDENTSARHIHSNKSVIDNLRQSDLDNVNNLSASVSRNAAKISGNSEMTVKLVKNLLEKKVIDSAPEGSSISIEDFNDNSWIDLTSTATYNSEEKKVVATGKQKLVLKTKSLKIPISKPKVMIYLDEIKKAVLQEDATNTNLLKLRTNNYELVVGSKLIVGEGNVRDVDIIKGGTEKIDVDYIERPKELSVSGSTNLGGRSVCHAEGYRFDFFEEGLGYKIVKCKGEEVVESVNENNISSTLLAGSIAFHKESKSILVTYNNVGNVYVAIYNLDLIKKDSYLVEKGITNNYGHTLDMDGNNGVIAYKYRNGTTSSYSTVIKIKKFTLDTDGVLVFGLSHILNSGSAEFGDVFTHISVISVGVHFFLVNTGSQNTNLYVWTDIEIVGFTNWSVDSSVYYKTIKTNAMGSSNPFIYRKTNGSDKGRIFVAYTSTSPYNLIVTYTDDNFASLSDISTVFSSGEMSITEDINGNVYILYNQGTGSIDMRIVQDGQNNVGDSIRLLTETTSNITKPNTAKEQPDNFTSPMFNYFEGNDLKKGGKYSVVVGTGYEATISGSPITLSKDTELFIENQIKVKYNNVLLNLTSYSEKSMENLIELSGVIPSSSEANIEVEFENNGAQLVGYFEGGV